MPRCNIHNEFVNGVCVPCKKRRDREYMAQCREARRTLRQIQAVVNQQPINMSISNAPKVML